MARIAKLNADFAKLKDAGHDSLEITDSKIHCSYCDFFFRNESHFILHTIGKAHDILKQNARETLFRPMHWPFDDGKYFFDVSSHVPAVEGSMSDFRNAEAAFVIPSVLVNGVRTDFQINEIGSGIVGRRKKIKDGEDDDDCGDYRVFCQWIGHKKDDSVEKLAKHQFGIVTLDFNDDRIGKFADDETPKRRKNSLAVKIMITCDICHALMVRNKHIAALLNLNTKRFVCRFERSNGSFHTFHVCCLLNWLLMCESDKQSPFCPECRGTGVDDSPLFDTGLKIQLKNKISAATLQWKKNPETKLPYSSMGLTFELKDDEKESKGNVESLKVIPFYRATRMI